VAFAASRKVGSAVVRNRTRRRLRAIVSELSRENPTSVAPGAYLISVGPDVVALSYGELRSIVKAALERLGEGRR
jgi:ribonuclease P protein component